MTSPYFDSPTFNEATGNYTVPATGRYSIAATINYSTTTIVTVSLNTNINPEFVVRRTLPSNLDLIRGQLPLTNFTILTVTLRSVLGNGAITLAGEVELSANEVIGLFYNADGMTLTLAIGGGEPAGSVWSMYRLT